MESKVGTIYRIVNLCTGEFYIGQTRMELKVRWSRHLNHVKDGTHTRLYSAMRAYGHTCFRIEALETVPISKLDRAERETIKKSLSFVPLIGYNMTPGGRGRRDDVIKFNKKEVLKKVKEDRSLKDIAKELKVCGPTLSIYIKKAFKVSSFSVLRRHLGLAAICSNLVVIQKQELEDVIRAGKTRKEIAEHFSCSEKCIKNKLQLYWGSNRLNVLKRSWDLRLHGPSRSLKGSANPMFGKRHSEEAKEKMRQRKRAK